MSAIRVCWICMWSMCSILEKQFYTKRSKLARRARAIVSILCMQCMLGVDAASACAICAAGMWWPEELRAAVSSRLFICGKCLFAHIGKWVACGNEGEPFYMFYMAVLRAILYALLPLLARSTWFAIRFPLSANAILCYCIRVPCEYSIWIGRRDEQRIVSGAYAKLL